MSDYERLTGQDVRDEERRLSIRNADPIPGLTEMRDAIMELALIVGRANVGTPDGDLAESIYARIKDLYR